MARNPATGAEIKRPAKRMGKMREKAVGEVKEGGRKGYILLNLSETGFQE